MPGTDRIASNVEHDVVDGGSAGDARPCLEQQRVTLYPHLDEVRRTGAGQPGHGVGCTSPQAESDDTSGLDIDVGQRQKPGTIEFDIETLWFGDAETTLDTGATKFGKERTIPAVGDEPDVGRIGEPHHDETDRGQNSLARHRVADAAAGGTGDGDEAGSGAAGQAAVFVSDTVLVNDAVLVNHGPGEETRIWYEDGATADRAQDSWIVL